LFLFICNVNMSESFIQQCVNILKKEEVKNEMKILLKPIIHFILYEIYPYIYIIILLVSVLFLMILAILILLIVILRNKHCFPHFTN
jgi:uncharacterized membrane protein